jgi:hypothetical protein
VIAARAALGAFGRLFRIAIVAALVIAAAPASLVGAIGAALAWLQGWPPARLYRAALWCLPMVAVWLAATAISTRGLLDLGLLKNPPQTEVPDNFSPWTKGRRSQAVRADR